jgi:mycothiol synthase
MLAALVALAIAVSVMTIPAKKPQRQLEMIWPTQMWNAKVQVSLTPGYELRVFQSGDEEQFFRLMGLAGFEGWNRETLKPWLLKILPDGWFVIVHTESSELVATTMATHNPTEEHPFGGELGWVAAHPQYLGKGLGLATCAAVTDRFLRAGYRHIYLKTDDFRLPAIKTYFKLGYTPSLHVDGEDHTARWKTVCEKLHWPLGS